MLAALVSLFHQGSLDLVVLRLDVMNTTLPLFLYRQKLAADPKWQSKAEEDRLAVMARVLNAPKASEVPTPGPQNHTHNSHHISLTTQLTSLPQICDDTSAVCVSSATSSLL